MSERVGGLEGRQVGGFWTRVRRALLLRCPRCGSSGILKNWFSLHDRCPSCGLVFARGEISDYWLGSYASGRAVLGVDPTAPPSYDLSARGSDLAARLVEGLDQLATTVRTADPKAVADLEEQPRPLGAIRRIPQI